MKLSIVIPVYNEEENLEELYKRLTIVLSKLPYQSEIIFIDDASQDSTPVILNNYAKSDERIRALFFSRNFGHQIAITAGLDVATGDIIVSMDGDLQDQPEVIPQLIEKFNEGFDIVYAKRRTRKDTLFKKCATFTFYRIINMLSSTKIPKDVGDFRLISSKVKDQFIKFKEHAPFLRGLVSWMGFRQVIVEFDRDKRFAGAPKYSMKKLLNLAFDGVMSFTFKPIFAIGIVGSISFFFGFIGGIVLFIRSYIYHVAFATPELILFTLFFLAGIMLLSLGILGAYIVRISSESQNRPRYIIREKIGF